MVCGEKVKFLEDGWKEDRVSLKLKYPTLFSMSYQQQNVIQQMEVSPLKGGNGIFNGDDNCLMVR